MTNAQEWLNGKYTDKNTKEIDSKEQPLEGVLEVKDFPNLEKISLSEGEGITKLTIQDCPKVKDINANYNQITEVVGIEVLVDLEELRIGKNKIKNIDISKNKKLTTFICFDNPFQDNKVNVNNGIRFFNGDGAEYSTSLSTESSDKQKLLEIAEKLGIEKSSLEGKTVKEIEELINKKTEELLKSEKEKKEELDKITEKFPDLIVDGKVVDNKLEELENQSEEAKKLKDLGINNADEAKKLKEKSEKMNLMIEENLGPKYIAQIEVAGPGN